MCQPTGPSCDDGCAVPSCDIGRCWSRRCWLRRWSRPWPAPVLLPVGPGDVTIRIDVTNSRFTPEALTAVAGTRVRFLLDNADPIHHELITGGPAVHARHARGTEAEHPAVPGEVSVGPNGLAMTTFTFDEVGTFEFACHLPGHYEYGMHGTIEVVADG